MQHGDCISAEDGSLDERVQCKRHAGNFFFVSSSLRSPLPEMQMP